MKAAGAVLAIVGASLIVLGAYLGLSATHHAGTDCGSAFTGVQPSVQGTPAAADCDSAISDRRLVALVALIPGVGLAVGGAVLARAGSRAQR